MKMHFTEKDFDQYADFLGKQESQDLRQPTDFIRGVQRLAETGERQDGDSLPWSDAPDHWRLRSSELTIWAGVNGHGKSLLLGMIMLWQMAKKRVVIASLEMLPAQTLYRMCCQFAGCRPDANYSKKIVESMVGKLWLYDQQDTVSMLRILAMVIYCAKELQADHVVIDSLLKCGIGEDDYNKQKEFIDRLQWIAKTNSIHIHLVAHMRKKENEHYQSGKLDIRGTSAISDLADNVVIVSRNKRKEKMQEKSQLEGSLSPTDEPVLDQHDAFLTIEKNRHGQKEGTIGLFFDKVSYQYKRKDTTQAMLPPWHVNRGFELTGEIA